MVTESEILFNVIIKASVITGKKLMIDIKAARQTYDSDGISDVGWIRAQDNLADGLAKFKTCTALEKFLDTEQLKTFVEQWVVRSSIQQSRLEKRRTTQPEPRSLM